MTSRRPLCRDRASRRPPRPPFRAGPTATHRSRPPAADGGETDHRTTTAGDSSDGSRGIPFEGIERRPHSAKGQCCGQSLPRCRQEVPEQRGDARQSVAVFDARNPGSDAGSRRLTDLTWNRGLMAARSELWSTSDSHTCHGKLSKHGRDDGDLDLPGLCAEARRRPCLGTSKLLVTPRVAHQRRLWDAGVCTRPFACRKRGNWCEPRDAAQVVAVPRFGPPFAGDSSPRLPSNPSLPHNRNTLLPIRHVPW